MNVKTRQVSSVSKTRRPTFVAIFAGASGAIHDGEVQGRPAVSRQRRRRRTRGPRTSKGYPSITSKAWSPPAHVDLFHGKTDIIVSLAAIFTNARAFFAQVRIESHLKADTPANPIKGAQAASSGVIPKARLLPRYWKKNSTV